RRVAIQSADMISAVENCTYAKDYPICGDPDVSFYLFFKEIKKYATVILSGEGADELFGGYLHYYLDRIYPGIVINSDCYQSLLKDEYQEQFNLKKQHVDEYLNCVNDYPVTSSDSDAEKEFKQRIYS